MSCCAGSKPPVSSTNSSRASCPTSSGTQMPSKLFHAVKITATIAVAAFALYTNWVVAAASLATGALLGIAYVIYMRIKDKPLSEHAVQPFSCAQGSWEFFSEIRIPAAVSAVLTTVYFVIHMPHSPYLVGFFSVPIGIFIGKTVTDLSFQFYDWMRSPNPIASAV